MATGRKTRGIVEVPESLRDEAGVLELLRDLSRSVRDVQAGRVGVGTTTVVDGGTGGPAGPPGPPGAPAPGTDPDLTPPPTPSNLTAVAGISNVIIEWDVAVYSQGHGNLQTNIYGAKYPGTGPEPTFGDAVLVGSAPQPDAIFILATDPSTQWHLWAKFQSRDGVESVSPAGGANGVEVTTGQDVTLLLDALTGTITESQLFSTLGARIDLIDGIGAGSVNARIATETAARTSADSAISASITTLQASVGSNTAAIAAESIARANADGSLFAQYTVKVDLNGYVSGYGLASTSTGAAPTSSFIVRADRFAVSSPSGPGITPATPFIVNTTPLTENGVTIPPGVYIDGAYIRNLTAGIARMGNAWVDDAKIATVSAGKLTAGSIGVGSYIQSNNYIAGVSGWRINGSGSAELAAASIRGQITAAQINSNGLSIKTAGGVTILDANTPLTSSYINAEFGGANLLPNSSFEVDSNSDGVPDDWTNVSFGSGITVTRTQIGVAGFFMNGAWCHRLSVTAITAPSQNIHAVLPPTTAAPLVIAGQAYSLSVYARTNTLSYQAHIGIRWLDELDSQVGSTVFTDYTFTAGGVIERVKLENQIAPAGAVKARVQFGIRRPSTGDTTLGSMWFDGIQLEQAQRCSAYAPSDLDSVNFANKISAANIALFMESAAITDAYIGTLNAAKIIAGTITTDKLVIGSVTTNVVADYDSGGISLPAGSSTYTAASVANASITSTGGYLKVEVSGFVQLSLAVATAITDAQIIVRLKSGATVVGTRFYTVSKINGALGDTIQTGFHLHYLHLPSAGTRSYSLDVTVNPQGANFASGDLLTVFASTIIQEFKV